jgi:hypothetical protein
MERLFLFRTTIHVLTASSTKTSAGLKILFEKKRSATGTVSDENPYPRAPLTNAARRAITKRTTAPVSRCNMLISLRL